MTEKNRMNIAMAFNEKYVKYAYTTILSLFMNNTLSEIYLYVLHRDISQASQEYISGLCDQYRNHVEYIYVDCSNLILPSSDKWPVEVYFRLFMMEKLPKELERILYLDSDMIINKSLAELYNTNLDDYDLAGCYDLALHYASLDVFLLFRNSKLSHLFTDKSYVNSGMLLFNLNRMRSKYSFSTYLDALKELEYKVFAPDQDLINYVHEGKIKLLDVRKYNYPGYIVFTEMIGEEKAQYEVPIIHFIAEKPWQGGNHYHYSTEMIWWDYAFKTPFAETFMKQYISESVTDPKLTKEMLEYEDTVKDLKNENEQLQHDLNEAMESVKKVIGMFSNQ